MPETRQQIPPDAEPLPSVLAAPANVRIDAAHQLGRAPAVEVEAASVELSAAVIARLPADELRTLEALPRIRLQGRQLAQLLQERQSDLDRREAQQQAMAADLENQLRAARLWLGARQQELADREARLVERERQTQEQSSRVAAAESLVDATRQKTEQAMRRCEDDIAARTAALDALARRLEAQAAAQRATQQKFEAERTAAREIGERERQQIDNRRTTALATVRLAHANLEQRRVAIEAEATELERRRAQWIEAARRPSPEQQRHARELTAIAEGLAAREQNLATAEDVQLRAEAELAALREELGVERERLEEQARVDRRRVVEAERATAEALSRERAALARRHEQLNEREASLERLRAELGEIHRQALEARLAAEETLSRLAGAAPPAEIARAVAEARARLADHWRLAAERVAAERTAVTSLRDELAAQALKLTAQKDDLAAWAERRQKEFDAQSTDLSEREDQLRELENAMLAERDQWDRDRLAFEQQLRGAMTRLRDAAA